MTVTSATSMQMDITNASLNMENHMSESSSYSGPEIADASLSLSTPRVTAMIPPIPQHMESNSLPEDSVVDLQPKMILSRRNVQHLNRAFGSTASLSSASSRELPKDVDEDSATGPSSSPSNAPSIATDEPEPESRHPLELDGFLVAALRNRKDRTFLTMLENDMENFILDKSRNRLEFPTMNSYQRLVVHKVAGYFKLSHVVDSAKKAVIIYRSADSEIPLLRFADLVEDDSEERPSSNIKIMRRNTKSLSSRTHSPSNVDTDRKMLSLEEREARYQEARARIFNDEQDSQSETKTSISSSTSSPSPVSSAIKSPSSTDDNFATNSTSAISLQPARDSERFSSRRPATQQQQAYPWQMIPQYPLTSPTYTNELSYGYMYGPHANFSIAHNNVPVYRPIPQQYLTGHPSPGANLYRGPPLPAFNHQPIDARDLLPPGAARNSNHPLPTRPAANENQYGTNNSSRPDVPNDANNVENIKDRVPSSATGQPRGSQLAYSSNVKESAKNGRRFPNDMFTRSQSSVNHTRPDKNGAGATTPPPWSNPQVATSDGHHHPYGYNPTSISAIAGNLQVQQSLPRNGQQHTRSLSPNQRVPIPVYSAGPSPVAEQRWHAYCGPSLGNASMTYTPQQQRPFTPQSIQPGLYSSASPLPSQSPANMTVLMGQNSSRVPDYSPNRQGRTNNQIAKPMYDYLGQGSYDGVSPSDIQGLQAPSHILELCPSDQNDHLDDVKIPNGNIKHAGRSQTNAPILVIFKTSRLANHALDTFHSDRCSLRLWKPKIRKSTVSSSATSTATSSDIDANEQRDGLASTLQEKMSAMHLNESSRTTA